MAKVPDQFNTEHFKHNHFKPHRPDFDFNGKGKVFFKPKHLPCNHSIKVAYTTTNENGEKVAEGVHNFYVRGMMVKMVKEVTFPSARSKEILVRPDIRNPEAHTIAVYKVNTKESNTCKGEMVSRKDIGLLKRLSVYHRPSWFINVTDGEFEGKKCKVYTKLIFKKALFSLYVDEENNILGYKSVMNKTTRVATITFGDSAPLDLFVIDSTKYPGCDVNASKAPVVDFCDRHSRPHGPHGPHGPHHPHHHPHRPQEEGSDKPFDWKKVQEEMKKKPHKPLRPQEEGSDKPFDWKKVQEEMRKKKPHKPLRPQEETENEEMPKKKPHHPHKPHRPQQDVSGKTFDWKKAQEKFKEMNKNKQEKTQKPHMPHRPHGLNDIRRHF